MKKNKNFILIIIIILVISFFIGISFYKFEIFDKNIDKEKENYTVNDFGNERVYKYDIDYTKEYSENIITEIVSEIEYSVAYEENVLYGKVFIGSDKKLYLSDELYKKNYLLLDEEIETLYNAGVGLNICSVYAITKSGELYHVGLDQPVISSYFAEKIDIEEKVTKFTNLSLNMYLGESFSSVIVYTSNGNMYDAVTSVSYNPNIVSVMKKYIIYDTGLISNESRKILVNSNGDPYKVNIIAVANKPIEELEGNPTIIIVTEDNKLIYTYNDKTYEYKEDVKIIGVDEERNIVIIFENDDTIIFPGTYDSNYYAVLTDDIENEE